MVKTVGLIVALSATLFAGLAWQTALKKAAQLQAANGEMQSQLQTQQAELETLRQKIKGEEALLAARQANTQVTVSAIQQQLALAQAHVLEMQAKVAQAKAERERLEHILQTGGEAQLSDQIHHDEVELKELDEQGRNSKANDGNLKNEQNQALAQQKQAHGEAAADIRNQVAQQKSLVKQTQQTLKYWQKQRRNPDQPTQVKNFSDTLAGQEAQLAALQNQLGLIKQDERVQTQVVKDTVSREHSIDKYQQGNLDEERKKLKADLQALNLRKATNDRDQGALKAQVQRARDQEKSAEDQVREAQKTVTTLQIQVTNQQLQAPGK